MNHFAHFLRFFSLSDDSRSILGNMLTPTEPHPTLPAIPGDVLRWLVPKSDLAGCPGDMADIVLLSQTGVNLGKTGATRTQQSEQYVQFDLSIDGYPVENRQFAIMRTSPGETETTVLGTISGSFSDLDSYINAIQKKFESYPHAPVLTIRKGNRLSVRIYRSSRFQPSDEDLISWRIGLGKVAATAYNTNSPALLAQSLGTVNIDATDSYQVVVSDDIETGNIYQLQGISCTANDTDTPATILAALGVTNSRLVVPTGTVVTLQVQAGSYRSDNRNRPSLQMLYDTNNGAGQDRYKVLIGQDVRQGNIYQVSATGMTTKTVIAGATDTSTTIAALFNTSGGFMLIPQGQTPSINTDPGSVVVENTNLPTMYLTDKIIKPASTVTRWRLFVGSSIQRNNTFIIEQTGISTKNVVAKSTDTPITIAEKLGYSSNPFTIDVPQGSTLSAYAKRGPRYSEPDDVAPVRFLAKPRCVRPDQVVAEVRIGSSVSPGVYSLGLFDKQKGKIIARSNPIRVQLVTKDTVLLRWGSLIDQERVFAYQYAEIGLTQRLRLPLHIGTARQFTQESQYITAKGKTIRSDIKIDYQFLLRTDMQPASFHKALLMALKHPRLLLDGESYQCLSDYRESEATPVQQLFQAEADITFRDFNSYRPGTFNELDTLRVAHVDYLANTEVFGGIWFQNEGSIYPVREGLELMPAEYDLRVLCPAEPYRLTVYVNHQESISVLLTPGMLNRTKRVRISSSDRIVILAEAIQSATASFSEIPAPIDPVILSDTPEIKRGRDFNGDFNNDFK